MVILKGGLSLPYITSLGVGKMIQSPSTGYITDLNGQEAGTFCAASSNTQNLPSDASDSDKGYFCFGIGNALLQIGGRNGIYHLRIKYNNTWGNWVKI